MPHRSSVHNRLVLHCFDFKRAEEVDMWQRKLLGSGFDEAKSASQCKNVSHENILPRPEQLF
ncbi:MAG: hypothetical protein V7629_15445 [Motiliproteus sp.]